MTRVPPCVSAIDMGYGHLRPAAALAEEFGTHVSRGDRAPLADARDRATLSRMHRVHMMLSLGPGRPIVGAAMQRLLESVTFIPRMRRRGELAAPNAAARHLRSLIDRGFGNALVSHLKRTGAPLISTYFAQAVVADAARAPNVFCVVTDSDCNRVWVSHDPSSSRIRYCVPMRRTARRLESYGVDPARIHVTGFPLPPSLLGGPDLPVLEGHLGSRLLRLDPTGAFRREARPAGLERILSLSAPGEASAPLRLTFAIGGAGAQTGLAGDLLRALREPLHRGAVHLTLVAGVRDEVAARLEAFIARHAPEAARAGAIEVIHDPTFDGYLRRFETCLAATDVLWTKPSEMTFFAALGIPLVLAPPLGHHERGNGTLARRKGFGLDAPALADVGRWLESHLHDGTLARAAWAGFTRMSSDGTYRVAELVRASDDGPVRRSSAGRVNGEGGTA